QNAEGPGKSHAGPQAHHAPIALRPPPHYLWPNRHFARMDAMNAPDRLKLQAIDEEALAVLSAHIQDAVLKVGDLPYLPKEKRFAIAMNRFGWEVDDHQDVHQRRRSALVFDR